MNTIMFKKSFCNIPAYSVSGSFVVSIAIAIIIFIIISVIIITQPGMA